jgi:hypothetical protein
VSSKCRVGCKKKGAVECKETKEQGSSECRATCGRQLLDVRDRDRSSIGIEVVQRNLEIIRTQPGNHLDGAPSAISNLSAQQVCRLSGHHTDRIPAFTVESDPGET